MLNSENEKSLKMAAAKKNEYGAKSIKILEGLEAVRKRPAMYIGSTNINGLHHLVYEVVDNSVDEALGGHCNKIKIILHTDDSCSVQDNGRGIPVEMHPTEKISATEVVLTKLHAGGKFDKDSYKYSGGLHGVGVSVVNALSSDLEVSIEKNGHKYQQFYKRGKPQGNLKEVGESKDHGTYIRFTPDSKIFDITDFNFDTLSNRFRELSFLNKGLRIDIIDERSNEEHSFYFEGGIASFVEHVNAKKTPMFKEVIEHHMEDDVYMLDFACQYNDGYAEQTFSFVNNIRTMEGGTHEAGFKGALTKACNKYAQSNKLLKDGNLSSDDVREGLVAVISIKVPEPQFEGQTKTKLGNAEVKGVVDSWLYSFLCTYFEENPTEARKIIQKALIAQQARSAAKRARELTRRKTVLESSVLPGKLADCSDANPENTELYIVEGDSAGGCFSGDTEIALADGRNVSFETLIKESKSGKRNYCYTINKKGSIEIAPVKHPRVTKSNTSVIKVALDNDEEIICTPDHRFMLKDGSYKKAENLTTLDSLMPLYRKLSKKEHRITIEGYEMLFDPKSHKWIFTHLLADKLNLKARRYAKDNGSHKHHINFNKLDNTPENIVRLTPQKHLELHRKHIVKTLHTKQAKKNAKIAHLKPEYRKKIQAIMSTSEMKQMLSERAKKQWGNPEYKEFMKEKFLEFYRTNSDYRKENNKRLKKESQIYWENPNNRESQSNRVKEYFDQNPAVRQQHSQEAKQQWKNSELLVWRREKTKEQWTEVFRIKRKEAYNKTYYENTIKVIKNLYDNNGDFAEYEVKRKEMKNPNLLKYETFCNRFFNGNETLLRDAVKNYNHKIKSITTLNQKIDVYDIEVEETHNFALASGVFVHNSAKQGRDRFTQAILPLRGKILNVEKARLDKMLNNNEIKDLITAIGAGIGNDEFDAEKVRYHKVIIMTDADVDGSHIRILLLTFFFRHMLPLIENGYLYIAQPPLYKVKVGRESRYLKDDSTLSDFLFDWAGKNSHLKVGTQSFEGDKWKQLLEGLLKYSKEVDRLSMLTEIAPSFCHDMCVFLKNIGWEKNKFETPELVDKLKTHLQDHKVEWHEIASQDDSVGVEGESVTPKPFITFTHMKKVWELPLKFFRLEETEKVLSLLSGIIHLENTEWSFDMNTKSLPTSGKGALNLSNHIIKIGKSLMTIQRYKGLGEMDAEQLWETTMDPEVRTLLKVDIQDAIAADQWFSALMGDSVADRREYIAKHAHFVRNLDV